MPLLLIWWVAPRRKTASTGEREDESAEGTAAETDPDSTDATDDEEEGATQAEVMDSPGALGGADGTVPDDTDGSSERSGDLAAEDGESEESAVPDSEAAITSGTDGTRRIFNGSIEDARDHPAAARTLDLLKEVFGGHFITSNVAEALFHLKPALTAHRTMKRGDGFVRLFLFLRTQVKGMDRAAMRSFFGEDVLTLERLRRVGVRRSEREDGASDPKVVVREACRAGEAVVISYVDRFGSRTSRMIEPLAIDENAYSGVTAVNSYCYLRNDERTFLLGRIEEAIPADTELSFVSDLSA